MRNISRIGLSASVLAVLTGMLLGFSASQGVGDETTSTPALAKAVPSDPADLRAIEHAARAVAEKTLACTVGLELEYAQGSGVIVSEDGYVLTAGHVVSRPGVEVTVHLPNGSTAKATALGVHTAADIALVKIDDDGKWPYAPPVPGDEGPAVGDWCVGTGHPNGFQQDRSAPLRLGRVIDVRDHVLRTDCPITGGDSGGPLFDMQGRVIGIHSRIAADLDENLHGPVLACLSAWEELKQSKIVPAIPRSRFFDRFDIDRDGKVSRAELPDGVYARVFDRLASKYNLDLQKAYTIEELAQKIGFKAVEAPSDFGRPYFAQRQGGSTLPPRRFVRGRELRRAFGSLISQAAMSTVEIKCAGERVALGTVVDAGGYILTKASQLDGQVQCTLNDGRELPAQVVSQDRENDLALLHVDAGGLTAVAWSESAELRPGNWLFTPGPGDAMSIGVVSVAARRIEGTPGMLGVQIDLDENAARIASVFPNSGAADAGIKEGDVISALAGTTVRNLREVKEVLQEYRAGDAIKATVVRGTETLGMEVTLSAPGVFFYRFGQTRFNGPISRRRDGFPLAVQHDTVLKPTACGGPVVDSTGNVVGMNIARENRVASHAIPGRTLKPLVDRLLQEAQGGNVNEM